MSDAAAEYEAARTHAVVAERTDRILVRVHGRDPVKMVQGLISNDIANAPPGRAVYAAVMTPKGKMVADVRVLRHGADLLLETDRGAADALTAHLRKFVPPLFARFEDAGAAWAELGVYGPNAADVVMRALGVSVPADVREDDLLTATHDDASMMVLATSFYGVPGFDIIVQAAALERARAAILAAGARPAGHETLEVLRIEAGSPQWGAELTDTTIPLEAGLRERAISETKGCYTGQEVIIRILHRGHVNWVLRRLQLRDVPVPAAGAALINAADGKKVGRITSAARSPATGRTAGLGYVRREIEPGAVLHLDAVDGPAVTVGE